MLNAEYFKRIDALNYTMIHDDGQHVDELEDADVVLIGVSRTSKTPTSIYLANRGIRPPTCRWCRAFRIRISSRPEEAAGRWAACDAGTDHSDSAEPAADHGRRAGSTSGNDDYMDRESVADEIAYARKLCAKFSWAQIDVTRRSIEETAAAIMKLFTDRQRQRLPE